jgi:hypothetical protein
VENSNIPHRWDYQSKMTVPRFEYTLAPQPHRQRRSVALHFILRQYRPLTGLGRDAVACSSSPTAKDKDRRVTLLQAHRSGHCGILRSAGGFYGRQKRYVLRLHRPARFPPFSTRRAIVYRRRQGHQCPFETRSDERFNCTQAHDNVEGMFVDPAAQ